MRPQNGIGKIIRYPTNNESKLKTKVTTITNKLEQTKMFIHDIICLDLISQY